MEHSAGGGIEVLRARRSIEDEIGGLTLADWLAEAAEHHGDMPALSARAAPEGADEGWATLTWAQYRQAALETAAALADCGLRPGDVVAIMLPNRPEHLITDMAAVHAGGIPCTVYATFAPEQIEFVAADCAAAVAVLHGAAELERWRPALERLPGLHTVVLLDTAALPDAPGSAGSAPGACGTEFVSYNEFRRRGRSRYAADPSTVHGRIAALRPEDTATLLYTSGTTGNPKGVPETHHQVLFQTTTTQRANRLPVGGAAISYLPLAHIAERVLSVYLPIRVAGHLHFCPDPAQLAAYLALVRPHGLFGVPRVWEKLQEGLTAALEAAPPDQHRAVAAAGETAREYLEAGQYGRTRSAELEQRFAAADEQVLAPVRALVGLDRCTSYITAAAPMPDDTLRFFAGLGMLLRDVYGMTESCGAVTVNRPDAYRFGSAGRPCDGMEVAIAADGEILVRGPSNTAAYLNRPADTAALFDAEGWLHTGDLGSVDADGFVHVLDRKKELIITAGGENISPAAIENRLIEHPLIGQAMACGDGRPYPVALLTLSADAAAGWAAARGIGAASPADLARHPAVLAEIERAVGAANARLARVQQVKRWRLLPAEWSVQGEELTPSLKLKRRVVQRKYAAEIGALYQDPPGRD